MTQKRCLKKKSTRIPILILYAIAPVMMSGCCTWVTTDYATHAYRNDSVSRIERAVVTTNEQLIVLVDGARAESSRQKQFTIAVKFPANDDGVWVPKNGMTEGWNRELLDQAGALPVTIEPTMVIPAYGSALFGAELLLGTGKPERALYLVRHEKPDRMTAILYIVNGKHPREIEIMFDGREVKTPARYPLLVFLPVTLCVDIVALPVELYYFATYGEPGPKPMPTKNP